MKGKDSRMPGRLAVMPMHVLATRGMDWHVAYVGVYIRV